MNYYLGIDGGGTKTKFVLCDEVGHLCAQSTQATCHYLQCGLSGVTTIMREGLTACLSIGNLREQDISYCFAAIAGYGDIEADCEPIHDAVKKAFPQFPFQIGNDTENALAGSLAGKDGINIIAGTGSIGLGQDHHHTLVRSGGWHHAFGGDEGSAYWIACKLILHFTKQSDHREKRTLLYDFIKKEYQLEQDSDILQQCVVNWGFDRTKIASMAKSVYTLATLQDPVAIKIFQEAAIELAQIVLSIYHQLQFDGEVLLSYSGGVFQSGDYILKPLEEALQSIPNMVFIEPILSPSAGSILLAMQLHGKLVSEEIQRELKKCT